MKNLTYVITTNSKFEERLSTMLTQLKGSVISQRIKEGLRINKLKKSKKL